MTSSCLPVRLRCLALISALLLCVGCSDQNNAPPPKTTQSVLQAQPPTEGLLMRSPDSTVTSVTPSGDLHLTQYRGGKRHGYTFLYHPDSSIIKACWVYAEDTLLWTAYSENLYRNLLPIKGLTTEQDCVEVVIPFVDGREMYRGWIMGDNCPPELQVVNTCAVGVHRMYYPNGKLRATVDYDRDSILVYSDEGRLLRKTTTSEIARRSFSDK